MAAPLTYSFDHIHVFCTDLDATTKWFVDGVGAELVARRDSRGVPSAVLNLGGARILLRPKRDGENLQQVSGHRFGADHFGLEVSNVDATITELRSRGVEIEVEPWDFSPQARIAFITGPDGVRIELVQPR